MGQALAKSGMGEPRHQRVCLVGIDSGGKSTLIRQLMMLHDSKSSGSDSKSSAVISTTSGTPVSAKESKYIKVESFSGLEVRQVTRLRSPVGSHVQLWAWSINPLSRVMILLSPLRCY
jgi:ABC-type phosphate/phosphonate transport system ATPase subunit